MTEKNNKQKNDNEVMSKKLSTLAVSNFKFVVIIIILF